MFLQISMGAHPFMEIESMTFHVHFYYLRICAVCLRIRGLFWSWELEDQTLKYYLSELESTTLLVFLHVGITTMQRHPSGWRWMWLWGVLVPRQSWQTSCMCGMWPWSKQTHVQRQRLNKQWLDREKKCFAGLSGYYEKKKPHARAGEEQGFLVKSTSTTGTSTGKLTRRGKAKVSPSIMSFAWLI